MSLNLTPIEWASHSWNPMTGCLHTLADCPVRDNCYAAETARTRLGYDFRTVKMHPDRLGDVTSRQSPKVIFVGSMTDMMGSWWDDDEILDVIACCQSCRQHIFLWLTKKPERYRTFPWPDNCWLGASPLNQKDADWMIPLLLQAGGKHYFVSLEPLLGRIFNPLCACVQPHDGTLVNIPHGRVMPHGWDDITAMHNCPVCKGHGLLWRALDWIIAGGMTGAKARPSHPDWFTSLRDQCAAAGVPFLFKQWGRYQPVAGLIPHVQPGDICISENGFYDTVPAHDYICLANESDGEWMRPLAPSPWRSGKATLADNYRKLEGKEYLQMPAPIAEIMALRKRKAS